MYVHLGLVCLGVVPFASGHWTYQSLIYKGGIIGEKYEFIRKVSSFQSANPVYDVNSVDIRCGTGGLDGHGTKTLDVVAGDDIGFTLAGHSFEHPGPLQVYMSKAPSKVEDYQGDGMWTKVFSISTSGDPADQTSWLSYNITNFVFQIPPETPSGEYLVRAEGIGLHSAGPKTIHSPDRMGAQFYVGCAQVRVKGNMTTEMEPSIKLPGGYSAAVS